MSHFTVLVIGDNPEKQLQPYHEYECTGIEDEYVVFVPAEEDLEEEYKEYKDDYSSLEEFAKEYYGYYKNEDGIYGKRTNPNSKWDWYQLGGRWSGFFKLKNGANGLVGTPGLMTPHVNKGYADQLFIKDIDFDFMYNEAESKAKKKYEDIQSLFNGNIPRLDLTWQEILKDENLKIETIKRKFR